MTRNMAGSHHETRRVGLGAQPVWVRQLIRLTVTAPWQLAWALTLAGLALCWAIAYGLGGASAAPPAWFYVVIVLVAVRFGWLGALIVGVASGVLAGPLLPYDVSTNVGQGTACWVVQAAFFVIVGVVVATTVAMSTRSLTSQASVIRDASDVLKGLTHGDFRVVYQPIVELKTGHIVGVECLARWEHAHLGNIDPEEFITVAERSGTVGVVGNFVLRQCCRRAAAWSDTVLCDAEDFTVAVNISTLQLEDPTFEDRVEALIGETGLDPSWLYLEITETALMADVDTALTRMKNIKQLGVRFAIDDFGTGYSSLSYLQSLPIDVLKIDRSFVVGVDRPGTRSRRSMAALVIDFAIANGITAVAEGVETLGEATRLANLGCRFAQGFYFDYPLEAEVIEKRLNWHYGDSTPIKKEGLIVG